ncbi:hypothetical protein B2J88_44845 [Rhodococcus sp. SRB_17]|nr:hypothetical protein [Rhodococcus sp. SRB_17]
MTDTARILFVDDDTKVLSSLTPAYVRRPGAPVSARNLTSNHPDRKPLNAFLRVSVCVLTWVNQTPGN